MPLPASTVVSVSPVYLVRHGETASNLAKFYAGGNREPLTPEGRDQVKRLADALDGVQLGGIWSSSVARALESARLLGDRLGLDIRVDERLDEMRLGPWEGRTEDEVAREFPETYALWLSQPDQVMLDGRETLAQVQSRVMQAVADAAASPLPMLLVTHVAPIRVAVLSALRLPLGAYKRVSIPNASCVKLDCAAQQAIRFPQGTALRTEIERVGHVAA